MIENTQLYHFDFLDSKRIKTKKSSTKPSEEIVLEDCSNYNNVSI